MVLLLTNDCAYLCAIIDMVKRLSFLNNHFIKLISLFSLLGLLSGIYLRKIFNNLSIISVFLVLETERDKKVHKFSYLLY